MFHQSLTDGVAKVHVSALFGPDYKGSGSEYCPSEQNSSSYLEDILQEGLDVPGSPEIQEGRIARKPKRLRNSENWARNVKKSKRAIREEYVNYKRITVPAKTPKVGLCPCPNDFFENKL